MSSYIAGPAVVVSGRVALLLGRHLRLDGVRIEVRGQDAEVDATLNAWHRAELAYTGQEVGCDSATRDDKGPQPPSSSEGMTTAQVAATAKCTPAAVRKAAGLGRINGRYVGGQWRFAEDDVTFWLAARRRRP